jgi:hypothetical protein
MRIKKGYINIKIANMGDLPEFDIPEEDYKNIVRNGLYDVLTEGGQSILFKDY